MILNEKKLNRHKKDDIFKFRNRSPGQREMVVLPQWIRFRILAEHPHQQQPARRGDRVLRDLEDLLPQHIRRKVLDEVLQEPEGRSPGGRRYVGGSKFTLLFSLL